MTKQSGQRLTAKFCREVKIPGRYGDGHGSGGLSLMVSMTKRGVSKRFNQRISKGGKVTMIALGPYPAITLQEARQRALENIRLRDRGELELPTHAPTFAQVAEAVMVSRQAGSNDPDFHGSWDRSLHKHMAALSNRRINTITTRDVYEALLPTWNENNATAEITRNRVKLLFDYAIGRGAYAAANPAGPQLKAILPKIERNRQNYCHVAWQQLPAAIQALRAKRKGKQDANSKRAAEWVALTGCRAHMATEMLWNEIDLDNMVWTVPEGKMKGKRAYRCPITPQMAELLDAARTTSGYVFARRDGRAQSRKRPNDEVKLSKLTDAEGEPATAHGWRTTFRTWCQAQNIHWEHAEAQIAHSIGSSVQRAYERDDYLEQRRDILTRYNEYATSG